MSEPRSRFFKYEPKMRDADGEVIGEHRSPGSKPGFGDVIPGRTYVVLDEQAALLEHDQDFKELQRRPAKGDVEDRTGLGEPEEPDVAEPPAETPTAAGEPPQSQARERSQ